MEVYRGSLQREFMVGVYHGRLPWEYTVEVYRGSLLHGRFNDLIGCGGDT